MDLPLTVRMEGSTKEGDKLEVRRCSIGGYFIKQAGQMNAPTRAAAERLEGRREIKYMYVNMYI